MYGIEIVKACERPSVDLVFVHGLQGDSHATWTRDNVPSKSPEKPSLRSGLSRVFLRKPQQGRVDSPPSSSQPGSLSTTSSVFWPRDLLGPDLNNARILTYGYDAKIPTILNRALDGSIFTIAQDLVTRLEIVRRNEDEDNVPIIFVAHSLGGIIVKDALKFSQDQNGFQQHLHSIFEYSYGTIFFGTPHRGSDLASLGRIASRVAGLGLGESDQHLLRSLEQGSTELERIADSFSRMLPQNSKGLKVYTFQEGLPISTLKFAGKVVEDWSSVIGDAHEGKALIHSNHMNMCRFSSKDDADYALVEGVIQRWVKDAQKGKKSVGLASRTMPSIVSAAGNRIVGANTSTLEVLPPISLQHATVPGFRIPQLPARFFLGRDKELSKIEQAFSEEKSSGSNQNIAILHGMGGIGKTQIALAYAYQHRQSYKAIFWINAMSEQSILLGYTEIAQTLVDWAAELRGSALNFTRIGYDLGLGQAVSPTTGEVTQPSSSSRLVVDAIKNWLQREENGGWLLIMDSADNLEGVDLQSFLPLSGAGDILITSRRSQATQLGVGIKVDVLEPESSRDLLLKTSQQVDGQGILAQEWADVARTLGYLPLALAQAGSYMSVTQSGPASYLKLYAKQRKHLLEKKPPRALWQYGESVISTWEISFASIESVSPSAARLLLICGHFEPENIPYLFFELGSQVDGRRAHVWQHHAPKPSGKWKRKTHELMKMISRKAERGILMPIAWLHNLVVDPLQFRSSLALLLDYSLVMETRSNDGLILHPLVHAWCYHRSATESNSTTVAFEAVLIAGRALDWEREEPEEWTILRDFRPHVRRCASTLLAMDANSLDITRQKLDLVHAAEAIGSSLQDTEDLEECCKVLEFGHRNSSAAIGEGHPMTLSLADSLATALEKATLLQEAEVVRRQLSTIAHKTLSKKCSDYWSYEENLGELLLVLEKYDEAQRILESAILARERRNEIEEAAAIMINLGVLFMDIGQLDSAETLLTKAKANLPMIPGTIENHCRAIEWLALVEMKKGEAGKAEALIESSLALAKIHFGENDPRGITSNRALFSLFESSGRITIDELARDKIIETTDDRIHSWEALRGQDCLRILQEQSSVGRFFAEIGDYERSNRYLRPAADTLLATPAENLSDKHRDFLFETLYYLGYVNWDRGFLDEAKSWWSKSLNVGHRLARTMDERDLNVKGNIALCEAEAGHLAEAEKAFLDLIEQEQATDILTQNNLARVLQRQGHLEESEKIFRQALHSTEPHHQQESSVLLVKYYLATLYESMGKFKEAISLLKETFNAKELHQGIRSPATLKTALTLGRIYRQQLMVEEAIALAERIRPYLEYA